MKRAKLDIRLTIAEDEAIKLAAKSAGKTVSEWVRVTLLGKPCNHRWVRRRQCIKCKLVTTVPKVRPHSNSLTDEDRYRLGHPQCDNCKGTPWYCSLCPKPDPELDHAPFHPETDRCDELADLSALHLASKLG